MSAQGQSGNWQQMVLRIGLFHLILLEERLQQFVLFFGIALGWGVGAWFWKFVRS